MNIPEIEPAGDAALLAVFGEEITPEMYDRVRALASALERDKLPGIRELVISYTALLVQYDPLVLSFDEARSALLDRAGHVGPVQRSEPRLRELPTVYGGCYGVDLPDVAQRLGLPEEDLIRIFSEAVFTVYMLGHTPGNPYMGGLPSHLAVPRLERPREQVPAGTVAIAHQATVYPMDMPGGWRWLGRTAVRLFDPAADPPNYLQAGDQIKFPRISEEEYLRMGGKPCR